jgi:hypothetical protein
MKTNSSLMCGVAVGVLVALMSAGIAEAKIAKAKPESAAARTEREIDELRAQIQFLKDRLDEQAAISMQANAQLKQAQADADAAKAQTVAIARTAQASAAEIKTIPAQIQAAAAANKPKTDKIYYKGVSITMGGFAEAASIYRDHDETADISSSFSKFPFANDRAGHTAETRLTARQSRYSILAQGDIDKTTTASFYGEFDFQGAAQTANSNQSNSYNPRIRHLYGQVDWNGSGWHLLAGQNWSLLTLNNNGITPRAEVTPPQIDAQYIPGFAWARQPQVRLTKDFNKELWLAVSLENPQTTLSVNGVGPGVTVTTGQAPTNGFFNGTNYSLNSTPDVIVKAAWEKKVGGQKVHLEGFGLYRSFMDRINYTAAATGLGVSAGNVTGTATGGGVGGSIAVYDVIPKHLDLQASVMTGAGIGRYGSAGLPDATARPDGVLVGIPETMWLAGGTYHASPKWDLYLFGGQEAEKAKTYAATATSTVGYGAVTGLSNAGCLIEGGACGALNRDVTQYTGGVWWKFYTGSYGQARFGVQYSWTQRQALADLAGVAPKANENMLFTSFRFYPF